MEQKALWNISYGVYIVSTWDGERPTGCVANSVMQITSEPATVAISIIMTYTPVHRKPESCHHCISRDTDSSIIGTFGLRPPDVNNLIH